MIVSDIRFEIDIAGQRCRVVDNTDYTEFDLVDVSVLLEINDPNGNPIHAGVDFATPDIYPSSSLVSAWYSLNLVDDEVPNGDYQIIVRTDADGDLAEDNVDTFLLSLNEGIVPDADLDVSYSLVDSTVVSSDATSLVPEVTVLSRTHTLTFPAGRGSITSSDETINVMELFTGEYIAGLAVELYYDVSKYLRIYDIKTAQKKVIVWYIDAIETLIDGVDVLRERYDEAIDVDYAEASRLETIINLSANELLIYQQRRTMGEIDKASEALQRLNRILGGEGIDAIVPQSEGVPVAKKLTGYATEWLTGIGEPDVDLGRNGDFYINETTSEYYQKENGVWVFVNSFSDATLGSTDALVEGTTNLYYTEARVAANYAVAANTAYRNTGHVPLSQKGAAGGVAPLNASSLIDRSYIPIYNTDDINEGSTNLYYQNSRVQAFADTRYALKEGSSLQSFTTADLEVFGNFILHGEVDRFDATIIPIDDAWIRLNDGNSDVNAGIIIDKGLDGESRFYNKAVDDKWYLTDPLSVNGSVEATTLTASSLVYALGGNSSNWNEAYTHSQITGGNPHNITIEDIEGWGDMFAYVPNNGNPYIRAKLPFAGDYEIMAYADSGQLPASIWDGLPIASDTVLGGIKLSSDFNISPEGVLTVSGGVGTGFDETANYSPSGTWNFTGILNYGGNMVATKFWANATFEPLFSKNTAFNKNFGTIAGTVVQGNDGRLTTAYSHSKTTTGNPHNISLADIGESLSSINYWTKSGDDLSYSGGNVAINKTSADRTLDVNGTGRFSGGLYADDMLNVSSAKGIQSSGWVHLNRYVDSRVAIGVDSSADLYAKNNIISDGNITASGEVTAYSDGRLKDIIGLTPSVLESVNKLSIYDYTRNDKDDDEVRTGLIAQELQKEFPQFVSGEESEDSYLSINYSEYAATIATKGIQELYAEITSLRKELHELKSKLN